MKEELEEAQGWFRKAESDLATARRTATSEGPHDTACFHAHQAAEKYLNRRFFDPETSAPRRVLVLKAA